MDARGTIERLRRFYEFRQRRFAARAGKIEDTGYEDRIVRELDLEESRPEFWATCTSVDVPPVSTD